MWGIMKNGLIFENNELVYYKEDEPYHAGVIKDGNDIYYIGRGGRAVKGHHVVHRNMANDILKRGTYKFGDDYKLIKGSYIAPKRDDKKTHRKNTRVKKNFATIGCAVAMTILLVSVFVVDYFHIFNDENSSELSLSGNQEIILPVFEDEVLLCSDAAKALYDGEATISQAITAGTPYRNFVFNYTLNDTDGVLFLSENNVFSNSKEYLLSCDEKSLVIDNLKTGTEYFYKVVVEGKTYIGDFTTAKSTRYIYVSGMYNTRDIGGYTTIDGKTVKQGYIIRGTEIDGLVESEYFPTDENIEKFSKDMGFVFDLDLRQDLSINNKYKSRLSDNVTHCFYGAPAYSEIFNVNNKQSLKAIFSDLANPDNYPMYLHCTYGADRTGTIVFLLQGILNVSEDKMLTEYQQTGFTSQKFAESEGIKKIYPGLNNYSGNTIQEKIVSFLIQDIGVTQQEIDSIRNILLE